MAVTGFSLLLAAVSALAALAVMALPVEASDGPTATALRAAEVSAHDVADAPPPAETPPPDFTAVQYIDSAGCVFLRTDLGWRVRAGRDGVPVCGYPPTLSARRTDPDDTAVLFPKPDEQQGDRIHRELAEAIIPNMQAGELAGPEGAGQAPPTPLDMPGVRSPALASAIGQAGAGAVQDPLGLGKMIEMAPDLSRQMAGGAHLDRVCALIGGRRQAPGGAALGLCGSRSMSWLALASVAPPQRQSAGTAQRAGDGEDRTKTAQPGDRADGKAAALAKPRPQATADRAVRRSGVDPRMIPPGARFVQIGAFRDLGAAERTARGLAALGLPVVRSRGGEEQAQLIMVGPLDGREAIVRMIDRLRRAGYHDVMARR